MVASGEQEQAYAMYHYAVSQRQDGGSDGCKGLSQFPINETHEIIQGDSEVS